MKTAEAILNLFSSCQKLFWVMTQYLRHELTKFSTKLIQMQKEITS